VRFDGRRPAESVGRLYVVVQSHAELERLLIELLRLVDGALVERAITKTVQDGAERPRIGRSSRQGDALREQFARAYELASIANSVPEPVQRPRCTVVVTEAPKAPEGLVEAGKTEQEDCLVPFGPGPLCVRETRFERRDCALRVSELEERVAERRQRTRA
jgi:hypothetical protein